ncbi:hypothetical protein ACPEIF_02310 [Streptomyces sp. NPDC012600]|uniref:hypothetical protein n=1 Tax=Streptomyces sp. NPDC012600 TaxID=3415005 RepID=UPI003C2ED1CA
MKRTTASHERRRNIADAASGFPDRTRVLLYANLPEGVDQGTVTARLRAFAEARDFVVPDYAVIIDSGAVARPRRERPGWFKASELLRENRVEGVIAPTIAHIASTPGGQAEFRAWLATHVKFADYPDEGAASAVEVTRAEA